MSVINKTVSIRQEVYVLRVCLVIRTAGYTVLLKMLSFYIEPRFPENPKKRLQMVKAVTTLHVFCF